MNGLTLPTPLRVIGLNKYYGSLHAVKNVSFQVEPGEIFGLLGPNGAGKTSIISTIVTLEQVSSGNIEIFGSDVSLSPKEAKTKVGWVPQEVINHGFFNVEEILKFHAGYYGQKLSSSALNSLLERLDLAPHRNKKVKQLSGGMKRRLMIAKALCHKPSLLLLDEPTAGVDIELRKKLWDFTKELRDSGVAILLTTHYLEEAEELCDRVGFISKGELIKLGPTKSIVRDMTFKTIHLELFQDPGPLNHPFVKSQDGKSVVLHTPMTISLFEGIQQAGVATAQVKDMKVTEGDLEDAFRRVMEEGR